MMEFIVGFILGLIGSFIFWRFQIHLKPKIELPSFIVKNINKDDPEKHVYRLKVVNKSRRQTINIRVTSSLSRLIDVPNGKRSVGRRMQVSPPELLVLGPKNNIGQPLGLSPVHIFVIKIEDKDIQNKLEKGSVFMVTLSATDADSGSTVVHRNIYSSDKIVVGEYEAGLTTRIVDASQLEAK